jgi:hypothetical protein
MTTAKRVGGEVVAFCTKCRMDLAHTIIAMDGTKPVRVQCNTCNGQHNYRGKAEAATKAAKTAKTSKTSTRTTKPKTERVRLTFEDQLASKKGGARVYSPKSAFLVDELVNHPTFGVGYVDGVRLDKVDVVFKSGTKTLIHGRK